MDKFEAVHQAEMSGQEPGRYTEDIIAQLRAWDESYGIDISNVERDRLTVSFRKIPADTAALSKEIYKICPDAIDQEIFGLPARWSSKQR